MKKIIFFIKSFFLFLGVEFSFGLVFVAGFLGSAIDSLLQTEGSFISICLAVFTGLSVGPITDWCEKQRKKLHLIG